MFISEAFFFRLTIWIVAGKNVMDTGILNREQVAYWVKLLFGVIVGAIFSFIFWYQNQVHNPSFWYMTICVQVRKRGFYFIYFLFFCFVLFVFSSVILRNLKFSIPMVLDMTGCEKCKILYREMRNISQISQK